MTATPRTSSIAPTNAAFERCCRQVSQVTLPCSHDQAVGESEESERKAHEDRRLDPLEEPEAGGRLVGLEDGERRRIASPGHGWRRDAVGRGSDGVPG